MDFSKIFIGHAENLIDRSKTKALLGDVLQNDMPQVYALMCAYDLDIVNIVLKNGSLNTLEKSFIVNSLVKRFSMIKKTAEWSVETWNQILTPKLLQELSDKKSGISQIDVKTISINNDNLTNIKTSKFPDFKNDKTDFILEKTNLMKLALVFFRGHDDNINPQTLITDTIKSLIIVIVLENVRHKNLQKDMLNFLFQAFDIVYERWEIPSIVFLKDKNSEFSYYKTAIQEISNYGIEQGNIDLAIEMIEQFIVVFNKVESELQNQIENFELKKGIANIISNEYKLKP